MRAIAICAALLACGCGSTKAGDSDAAVVHDAAQPADMAMAPPDFAELADMLPQCNAPVNTGPSTMIQQIPMDAPTAMGGPAVADGTYFVTANVVYTGIGGLSGPTGVSSSGVNVISGSSYRFTSDQSNTTATSRASGTFTLNGTAINIAQLCPVVGQSQFISYDSDGTNVTIYTGQGTNGVQALTFTKQ